MKFDHKCDSVLIRFSGKVHLTFTAQMTGSGKIVETLLAIES